MRNLNDLWRQAVASFPDRTAAIHLGAQHTYAELDAMIGSFAGALRHRLSMTPGQRLGLIMPNCLHSIVCYLGAIRAGIIALPINIRLKAEEMGFVLDDAGADTLVVHRSAWPMVRDALAASNVRRRIVGVELDEDGILPVDDLLKSAAAQPVAAEPDDVAAIVYTSGTTGLPKGAMVTHANILFNVQATIGGHGFRPDDVHLLVVPLYHVTGLNTIMPTAFHQGAAVVISSRTAPSELLGLVEEHRATTMFGVPTTMILLAQTPDIAARDLSSLRLIAYSGAPMPVRAIHRLRELFPSANLHNFFGLTETTSVTTVLPDEQALIRPESIGRPVAGLQIRIADDAGDALPPGEVGELLVRGPSIVKGYYARPEATAEAIIDGWLHTGDAACVDDEGYVFLRGRKREMIIVGGENVYPIEVENVLTRHECVAEAGVIGMPHSVFGEMVKAVVAAVPGAEIDERELRRHCAHSLASYKCPQAYEFRDALPRNASGKVVKRELKAPPEV